VWWSSSREVQLVVILSIRRFPAGAWNFSLHHRVQNCPGAHPVSSCVNESLRCLKVFKISSLLKIKQRDISDDDDDDDDKGKGKVVPVLQLSTTP